MTSDKVESNIFYGVTDFLICCLEFKITTQFIEYSLAVYQIDFTTQEIPSLFYTRNPEITRNPNTRNHKKSRSILYDTVSEFRIYSFQSLDIYLIKIPICMISQLTPSIIMRISESQTFILYW